MIIYGAGWRGGEQGAPSKSECDSSPPGAGRAAERVRAGGLGPPHARPPARLFTVVISAVPGDKVYERGGGVSGGRAGGRAALLSHTD